MKFKLPISYQLKRNLKIFYQVKRARYALFIISFMFIFSLFSEFIANDKPLIIFYKGALYFPVLFNYKGTDFDQEYITIPHYKEISQNISQHGFMIRPLIFWGSNESNKNLNNYPAAPNKNNWLGTDDRGRDLFVRLLYGFRLSMIFALIALLSASILGTLIGGLQGFLGGKYDLIGQRLVELWNGLPFIFVIILLSHIFQPGITALIVCISLFLWISPQYFIRAECLKIKNLGYVKAAKTYGYSNFKIFINHILPNSMTPIITLAPFIMNQSILILAFLDYLGLGVQAPSASIGELLRQGKENIAISWWLVLFPLATLSSTLLLLNFIGDGAREAFDPRSNYNNSN